jgi:hypothetical protein
VDEELILAQFQKIIETPIEPVARRRSVGRLLGLDRIPDAVGSIRRRVVRKWRQWTCNAS